jgi:hydroxymethylbilane synthase
MALTLRIGSRPSALATAQAELVRQRLVNAHAGISAEIVPIATSGDKLATASLAQVGGKGLFVRELEQALAARKIDIAVHSMKDLPAVVPPQFRIAAVPERENPRDVLILHRGPPAVAEQSLMGWSALPPGATLGTSSPRRRMQALRLRPDLVIFPLRGNVDTRLRRLAAGDFDAITLALAGLTRLGRRDGINSIELDEREFVPAGGQGAIAIEALANEPVAGSDELEHAVGALNDPVAEAEVTAERAFLAAIGASCVSPVGVKATLENATLHLRAILFSLDGARSLVDEISQPYQIVDKSNTASGAALAAASIGAALGLRMLEHGAGELIGHG